MHTDLDSVDRESEIRHLIRSKKSVHAFYEYCYSLFLENLQPRDDQSTIEIGSGGGFLKEFSGGKVVSSDLIPYAGIDKVVDATKLPYQNEELHGIALMNVLHHLPDSEKFFEECSRSLAPGGRVAIIDVCLSLFSRFVLKYVHHEPYDPAAKTWKFASSGPLSGANGALPWIIFDRDLETFKQKFPKLKVVTKQPISSLYYWLSGGLKNWSLIPSFLSGPLLWLDRNLICRLRIFNSFQIIVIEKIK